jgi:hypothetical protein
MDHDKAAYTTYIVPITLELDFFEDELTLVDAG